MPNDQYGGTPMYGNGYGGPADYSYDPYMDGLNAPAPAPAPDPNGKRGRKNRKSKKEKAPMTASERVKKLTQWTGIAAGIAVIGIIFGIWGYMTGTNAAHEATKEAEPVIVTTADIARGETISEDKIQKVDVPKAFRSSGAINWDDRAMVVGQPAVSKIDAGTQLSENHVTGEETRSSLSQVLRDGYEAITISINDESGVAKLVKIGDNVRVLVTYEDESTRTPVTKEVLTAVPVVALGDSLYDVPEDVEFTSITLEVTPDQAMWVREAQKKGDVSCVLEPYSTTSGRAKKTAPVAENSNQSASDNPNGIANTLTNVNVSGQ